MAWVSEPEDCGLYWVYHKSSKRISVGVVLEEAGVKSVVLGQFGQQQAKFNVADLVGKVLFFPTEVPQPPEGV